MAKKTFLEDTRLFPELEQIVDGEKPKEERVQTKALPDEKKVVKTEAREALKQYAYYDSPQRHAKLKMWAITSEEPDEKDKSSVIRKAIDEFFEKRQAT